MVWDTNRINFFNAVSIYKHNLIPHLPAKNTILTNEILSEYYNLKEKAKLLKEKLDKFIADEESVDEFIRNLQQNNTNNCDKTIYELIKDDEINDKDSLIKQLKK